MARLHRQPICVASALLVPLLQLVAPSWLALDGVGAQLGDALVAALGTC
jgi:hypothetical protein